MSLLKTLFSPTPLPSFSVVYAALRILTGLLMAYHGYEITDGAKMATYAKWLGELHFPQSTLMAWLGKGAELVGGIGLALGLATRPMCALLAVTMLTIVFGMGHGKFWYEDQHPFLFVILCVLFFFGGAGRWSVDGLRQ
jgi:putative oxidoreductase